LNTKELAALAVRALEDVKGQNIVCLNVEKLTQITDFMIMVTGTSTTHLRSLAEELTRQVKASGQTVVGEEGRLQAEWILVDLGGVVVHIMLARTRALYSLEDLWNFDSSATDASVDAGVKGED
jgi:ribosome-associated protein